MPRGQKLSGGSGKGKPLVGRLPPGSLFCQKFSLSLFVLFRRRVPLGGHPMEYAFAVFVILLCPLIYLTAKVFERPQ
jgi:hypothetical protein